MLKIINKQAEGVFQSEEVAILVAASDGCWNPLPAEWRSLRFGALDAGSAGQTRKTQTTSLPTSAADSGLQGGDSSHDTWALPFVQNSDFAELPSGLDQPNTSSGAILPSASEQARGLKLLAYRE